MTWIIKKKPKTISNAANFKVGDIIFISDRKCQYKILKIEGESLKLEPLYATKLKDAFHHVSRFICYHV